MAIYHLDMRIISRAPKTEKVPVARNGATGKSVVAAAAYRSGEALEDERQEQTHDYTRTERVHHSEICLPDGAPERLSDRATLWNEVEAAERRKDAQLAREVQVSIPKELTLEQSQTLVRDYVKDQFTDRGMVADWSIHGPGPGGDQRNIHAHIMLTTREVGPDGFGKKQRDWNSKEVLTDVRESWAKHANKALEKAGHEQRIDHRSYAEQREQALQNRDLAAYVSAAQVAKPSAHIAALKLHQRGEESAGWEARTQAMRAPERAKMQAEVRTAARHATAIQKGREPYPRSPVIDERIVEPERREQEAAKKARREERERQQREDDRISRQRAKEAREREQERLARAEVAAEQRRRERAQRQPAEQNQPEPEPKPQPSPTEQLLEKARSDSTYCTQQIIAREGAQGTEIRVEKERLRKEREPEVLKLSAQVERAKAWLKTAANAKYALEQKIDSKNPINILKREQRRRELEDLKKREKAVVEAANPSARRLAALSREDQLSKDAEAVVTQRNPQRVQEIAALRDIQREHFKQEREQRRERSRSSGRERGGLEL